MFGWFDATHAHLIGESLSAWTTVVWDLMYFVIAISVMLFVAKVSFRSSPALGKRRNAQSAKVLGLRHVHSETFFRAKKALQARWKAGKLGAEDVDGNADTSAAEAKVAAQVDEIVATAHKSGLTATVTDADGTTEITLANQTPAVVAQGDASAAPVQTDSHATIGCCDKSDQDDTAARLAKAQSSKLPIAVIETKNDVGASQVDMFADMVDEVIANKDKFSSVILVEDSPGGAVTGYGLMLSETERLRQCSGLYIHGVVKQVAASGGMLQLLPCHKITAAPWSIIGSIGVVSQFLNFHGLCQMLGIEAVTLTAGKYKRTLTQFGKIEEDAKEHDLKALAKIHDYFKAAVAKWRPQVAHQIEDVCTGEHWLAMEVVEKKLGLVDEIGTPAQVLNDANQNRDLIFLSQAKPGFKFSLRSLLSSSIDVVLDRVIDRIVAKNTPFGRLD